MQHFFHAFANHVAHDREERAISGLNTYRSRNHTRLSMTTPNDSTRFICILEELETSIDLLKSGFGHLQEIDMGNTFYHLPHQLMASGFERLMKCYISLVYRGRSGSYPDTAFMRSLGHDLEILLDSICKHYYCGTKRPLIKQEYTFISTDPVLHECIRILSLFGKKGRYYNLDIVAGAVQTPIDPKREWQALESTVEDPVPFISNPESMYRDYYPRVHSKLIAKMERLVRTIALQFTLGDHAEKAGELRRTSVVSADFRNLADQELGTNDYRRSVQVLRQEMDKWIRRTDEEIVSSRWPTLTLTEPDCEGEWPFREGRVILECQDNLFCIIYISGYAFALNGAARSRYGIPDPHDAGVAILGKAVGPFIDAALSLK